MKRVVLGLVWMVALCCMACGGEQPTAQPPSAPAKAKPAETAPAPPSKPERFFPKRGAIKFLREFADTNTNSVVVIRTRLGDMTVRLYEETPLHRANFVFLAKNGFFDQTLFYRIEKGFMIQGGGTDDESVVLKRNQLGKYKLPAEINPKYFHKRGAIAMARSYTDNPKKESSEYNFYIVQGETYNDAQLKALELEHKISVPAAYRETYRTLGGAPHIDGEHTVFGEIIDGLEVVDKIAALEVDDGGWPFEDVPITVEVIK